MLILIMVLLFGGAFALNGQFDLEFIPILMAICGVCTFVGVLCVAYDVSSARVLDQKIAMYQEENNNIQHEIVTIVNNYQNFEKSTFESLKHETPLVLSQAYPQLNSNELVKQQITVYINNNDKIKSLRESQINVTVAKWWLYFGK